MQCVNDTLRRALAGEDGDDRVVHRGACLRAEGRVEPELCPTGRLRGLRDGLEHRVGGIEKADKTGNISYDPDNHDFMVRTRQAKVDAVAANLPPLQVDDPDNTARVLVLGWGSTYGPIGAGVRRVRKAGYQVAQTHLRHLNPFPKDLGEVLKRYDKVLVPEMNLGQLSLLLRGKYLVDAIGYNQVNGMPIKAAVLAEAIGHLVAEAEGIDVDLSEMTNQEVHS